MFRYDEEYDLFTGASLPFAETLYYYDGPRQTGLIRNTKDSRWAEVILTTYIIFNIDEVKKCNLQKRKQTV